MLGWDLLLWYLIYFIALFLQRRIFLCCWSSWLSFELYDEVQSKLWKPVNNIHPFVDKQTLDTIQSGTSDDKLNIYGSTNDLLSEYRSQVTSSIPLRHSQYFRAERELRVQFGTLLNTSYVRRLLMVNLDDIESVWSSR